MPRPPTAAEIDVLRLAARGLTTGQIGLQLGVSSEAVKGRIASLGQRVGVRGRDEIVARVFEAGLEVIGSEPVESEPGGASVDAELAEQLLTMARMIVTDQPLGLLRDVARRALVMAARSRSGGRAAA